MTAVSLCWFPPAMLFHRREGSSNPHATYGALLVHRKDPRHVGLVLEMNVADLSSAFRDFG
jgi:hypothetical protein